MKNITPELKNMLLVAQKNELTEHFIYANLAKLIKTKNEKDIFTKLSQDELAHHNIWASYTQEKVKVSKNKIFFYTYLSKIFGLSFGIKLMEKWEWTSQVNYAKILEEIPETQSIIKDEEEHEAKLISMIDDNKLKYMSSIVLGLNDALVEITWALAWLTMTIQDNKLVASSGLIIWISAAISMAASEYLSNKADDEETDINPLKACLYTWIAYIWTVAVLVAPYFIFSNILVSLWVALFNAVLVIAFFNYYLSVAKELNFKKRFLEMFAISMWVALLAFGIWYVVNHFFGLSV